MEKEIWYIRTKKDQGKLLNTFENLWLFLFGEIENSKNLCV